MLQIDYGGLLASILVPLITLAFKNAFVPAIGIFAFAYGLVRYKDFAVQMLRDERLVSSGTHYWKRTKGGGRELRARSAASIKRRERQAAAQGSSNPRTRLHADESGLIKRDMGNGRERIYGSQAAYEADLKDPSAWDAKRGNR